MLLVAPLVWFEFVGFKGGLCFGIVARWVSVGGLVVCAV